MRIPRLLGGAFAACLLISFGTGPVAASGSGIPDIPAVKGAPVEVFAAVGAEGGQDGCGVFPKKDCGKVSAILAKVPADYRPHVVVVMLKNKVRATPSGGGDYGHQRIYAPVLIAHGHVALVFGKATTFADDAIGSDGGLFLLDRMYLREGLVSLISRAPLPNAAPRRLLDAGGLDILKGTLEDMAAKCGVSEDDAARMDLDSLSRLIDADCARRF